MRRRLQRIPWRLPLLLALLLSSCLQRAAAESDDSSNAPATTGVLSGTVGGKRTLVLLDTFTTRQTHSAFFSSLRSRGHQLTFQLASQMEAELVSFGEYLYDNMVVFAPRAKLDTKALGVASIVDFVDNGGNLLLAGGPELSKSMRHVSALSGVEFDPSGSMVADHFSFAGELEEATAPHTVVKATDVADNAFLLGSAARAGKPILFRGLAHTVADDNVLAAPVLRAPGTAYSFSARKGAVTLHNAGADAALVTAVQARNNARLVFAGSLDLFSNRFFEEPGAGNQAFCEELSKWAFAERGVLRASRVTHRRRDGSAAELLLKQKQRLDQAASLFPEPEIAKNSQVYRIKDDITYSLVLEEYDADQGGWRPYAADDVQMEFVMLDAYERITLASDAATGTFSTTFTAPDTYGIFKFRILYRRVGLTVLLVSTQVSIRPYKHNEYERFIPSAYPYYAGALSLMGGFFIFTYVFINASSSQKRKHD
eukprot:TRINITY_DN818_c0_g2_i1.p1 TRINITY_DN818_c0_g2~~TRINITY_DN818_c0_g2_i1.p1  ORF type:complete len:484 (-),score=177.26 TRINITY_DN818_c0_g2_i1:41-1492(-)